MTNCVDDTSEKERISHVARGWREKITEINRKYSKPRLKMTPVVRASLLALRLYLIMLVIILIYKFYTLVR
ncbi:MAG: hypothetical protein QG646_604 [Euryarchaeota archaeon]|nr:hypothetical protein [Euryarchaeota archaeon]